MKTSDMRKLLKTARADIWVTPRDSSICHLFKAGVAVVTPRPRYDDMPASEPTGHDTFVSAEFQANDLFRSEYGERVVRSFLSLEGVGAWYAGEIQTSSAFGGCSSSSYESPDRAKMFWALIHATIATYNLGHVYPRCEMSQTLAALEKLGCDIPTYEVKVGQVPVQQWNERRREQRPADYLQRMVG